MIAYRKYSCFIEIMKKVNSEVIPYPSTHLNFFQSTKLVCGSFRLENRTSFTAIF